MGCNGHLAPGAALLCAVAIATSACEVVPAWSAHVAGAGGMGPPGMEALPEPMARAAAPIVGPGPPRALRGALAYLASGSVKVLEPGQQPRTVHGDGASLAWSPDATLLAVGTTSGIDVVRADGGGPIIGIPMPHACLGVSEDYSVWEIAWGPTNTMALTCSLSFQISEVFEVKPDGSGMKLVTDGDHPQWALDGTLVALRGPLQLLVATPDGSSRDIEVGYTEVISLAPDGRHLLLGPGNLDSLIDLAGDEPQRNAGAGSSASWSWDSSHFCTATNRSVRVVALADLTSVEVAHGDSCVLSPDGSTLVVGVQQLHPVGETSFLLHLGDGSQQPLEDYAFDVAWAPP